MSTPALPGIFGTLEPILNNYGYFAVGGLVLVEDFGIPVPGETILIAASLYAGAGRLNVVAVGVIAWICAVLGDNIGFLIGHSGGRRLALKYGRYVFLTSARLDRAEHFFDHHGGKIIVAARFIEGLRQANGIVAGITGMHWKRFIPFNALGAALWVGLWVSVGYLAGNHITTIYEQITRYSLYVLIALAVALVALIGWRVRRHLRERGERAETADGVSVEAEASVKAEACETAGNGGVAEADETGDETVGNGGAAEADETAGNDRAAEADTAGVDPEPAADGADADPEPRSAKPDKS
jgi:membrane protein DedA with SNARE-associated domain